MPKVKGKRDEYRFVRELVTVMGISKGGLKELYDKLYDSRDALHAENQRLKEALEKLLNEGDIGIHCFDNGDGAYIGNAVHPESEAVLEAKKALEVGK